MNAGTQVIAVAAALAGAATGFGLAVMGDFFDLRRGRRQ